MTERLPGRAGPADWDGGPLDASGRLRLAPAGHAAGGCRMLLAGDLCPIGRPEELLASGRLEEVFGDCLPLIGRADLTVVNLESPLCRSDSPIAKCGPAFRCDPRIASALRGAGVDVACLANNHILDQGPAGLYETNAALDAAGVLHVGAGRSPEAAAAPLAVSKSGSRIALLNFAEGEFSLADAGPGAAGLDPAANCAAVRAAAGQADAAVVILHAGNEQVLFPSPRMQRRCRELIDAGAAAVVAHHPHVVQGIEVYRGRPIVYSLGNFLFDWPEPEPETDAGFLLDLTLAGGGVSELHAVPFRKSAGGGVELLAGPERAGFIALLNHLSAPLGDAPRMDRLWRQQCAWLYEHRYRDKLRRMKGYDSADAAARSRLLLLAWNLFNCPAHGEAMHTILRQLAEGGPAPLQPEARELDELMDRLKGFARAAAVEPGRTAPV